MVYQTLADFNVSAGPFRLFLYSAQIVPLFIPLVLFSFFVIIWWGVFFSKQRLSGKSSFPVAFAVAGYATLTLALALSLIPDLIPLYQIITCLVVSMLGTVWLMLSNKR